MLLRCNGEICIHFLSINQGFKLSGAGLHANQDRDESLLSAGPCVHASRPKMSKKSKNIT